MTLKINVLTLNFSQACRNYNINGICVDACPASFFDPVLHQLVPVEVVNRYCVVALATHQSTPSSGT